MAHGYRIAQWSIPGDIQLTGARLAGAYASVTASDAGGVASGDTLFDPGTMRPIRLTAMHLDRDPGNNEEWNLVTACRPCHVAHDAPDLAAARSEARLRTRLGAGQLELFPELV
jgi:hypothetical protein